jgi:hypothetical protein
LFPSNLDRAVQPRTAGAHRSRVRFEVAEQASTCAAKERRLMSGEIADVRYRGADVAKDAGCGKAFMFSSSRVITI